MFFVKIVVKVHGGGVLYVLMMNSVHLKFSHWIWMLNFFICSYYRPPDSLQHSLLQPQESLNKVLSNSIQFPNAILAGDFNLPGIVWIDGGGQLGQNPAYGSELNSLFLDIVDDSSLEQFVTDPTRNENILDLVFTSFQTVSDISGMSDHEAVLLRINAEAYVCPQNVTEHTVFLYHKGNVDAIRKDMIDLYNDYILADPDSRTVEEN